MFRTVATLSQKKNGRWEFLTQGMISGVKGDAMIETTRLGAFSISVPDGISEGSVEFTRGGVDYLVEF